MKTCRNGLNLAMAWALTGLMVSAQAGESPASRLAAGVENDETISREARAVIEQAWKACDGCNEAEFMAQALSVVSPQFRELLAAYEGESYEACIGIVGELKLNPNRFVSINAAAYEALSLSAAGRFEEAIQRIESLFKDDGYEAVRSHTYLAAELSFVHAYCLVSDLQFEEGTAALDRFLLEHPDAPIRLAVAARQMLTELHNRETENIAEVVDLMNNSHGRLRIGDTGKVVQGRQERILDLLDKLIKEAEDHECKCKSAGQSQNQKQSRKKPGSQPGDEEQQRQQRQAQQIPKSPMQESGLPGPFPAAGSLREARRANPAETWGNMPPLERERILQALRESFPNRYRQLVEQYYEELAKKP